MKTVGAIEEAASSSDERTTSVFDCPECLYWCLYLSVFHEHYITVHIKDPAAYRCSACPFSATGRHAVRGHFRSEHPSLTQSGSQSICNISLPESEYAEFQHPAIIPCGVLIGFRSVEEDGSVLYMDKQRDATKWARNPPTNSAVDPNGSP